MKFKLIPAFINVLLSCKIEEGPFKIGSTRVVTTFLSIVYDVVPDAQGKLTLQSKVQSGQI